MITEYREYFYTIIQIAKKTPLKINRLNFIRSAATLATLSMTEIGAFAQQKSIETKDIISPTNDTYWRELRQLFPLSKDLTYLNNGTFGPSPYPVIDAMREAMMDQDREGNYGGYDSTPGKIAKFVGADESEITLTHNVTEGVNIACWGVPLKKGDEVIISTHEHVGNMLPWMTRMKVHGIVLKKFKPGNTADETLDNIKKQITSKTRVIATPHIPCTQGQVFPVKEICQMAREKGIYSLIDGAHGPGMLVLDLHDLGCDTYASCTHKWMLGPKGTGFLYVRKDFRDTVQTYYGGAGTADEHWDLITDPITIGNYAPTGHRYYGGTQANGLYKGVNAAIDFIESIGIENVHNRISYLGKYMQDKLLDFGKDKIEVITPTEDRSRCAVNGFKVKFMEHSKLYEKAGENKIRIRIVPECGLNSLRVSTHIYNSTADVDKFIDLIKKLV